MTDILLVEDHEELNELMRIFLEKGGYSVKGVYTGEEALAYLRQERAKLVILDVSLPGMDGFAVCASVRETSHIPILFLSASVDKEDKMNGFLQGADDYVEKPVDMELLCAKINAMIRRNYSSRQENAVLHSGAVSIDKEAKRVFLNHREITLTAKEYELLVLFAENPGKTLNKQYLFQRIWGADSFSEEQTLTVHVKMLRDKIEEEPKHPKRIQTVWGIGYRYEEI